MVRGDELIEQLRDSRTGQEASDAAAHELLDEILRDYPPDRLAELMRSGEPRTVKAAAWLVSELGAQAASLMDEVRMLLGHPLRYVRVFAADAVLAAATEQHGATIAEAVGLVADGEPAVRWKAATLLARMPAARLTSCLPFLRDARLRGLTTWLLAGPDPADVGAALAGPDRAGRLFAAAAAVRVADSDEAPLHRAAASDDEEIVMLAQAQLDLRAAGRRRHHR